MRRATLLIQVLIVNLLLIAAAVVAASIASNPDGPMRDSAAIGLVLGFALATTVAVNVYLLSRRFEPLERLVEEMEQVDLSRPLPARSLPGSGGSDEVRRIDHSFKKMLERLEAERRQGARSALEAQERERERIARNLHDEVNQALTGLLLRIEAMRRKAEPELAAELAETGAVAGHAMEELLSIARRLRPTILDDLGLEAALSTLVAEVGRGGGPAASFELEGQVGETAEEVQLVAYRIAQEALTNAVKHGGVDHVRVRLIGDGERLELRVSDDGSGFDVDASSAGLGLAGMRERALLCSGILRIDSEPGAGTRVTLQA